MGGGSGDGLAGGVYRTQDGGLIMTDGLGRVFHDSQDHRIGEEYFKSPMSKLYSTLKGYAVRLFPNSKDISSKL